jgi:hypothetical protein
MLDERELIDEFELAAEKLLRPPADVAAPVIVALRPSPTAGRAPPGGEDPAFRENVDEGVPARFPAAEFAVPRLPMVPVLLELRADMEDPDRPGAAPKRAPEGGAAADLPPFMPYDRDPYA